MIKSNRDLITIQFISPLHYYRYAEMKSDGDLLSKDFVRTPAGER